MIDRTNRNKIFPTSWTKGMNEFNFLETNISFRGKSTWLWRLHVEFYKGKINCRQVGTVAVATEGFKRSREKKSKEEDGGKWL